MIIILTTQAHAYTHAFIRKHKTGNISGMAYHSAFRQRKLPAATYIFSDLDRLGFWELELAGYLFRELQAAGMKVLNDPARFQSRFELLQRLRQKGVNRFSVWRAADHEQVEAFPVFLRTEAAHRGPLSDLIHDPATLAQAIDDAVAAGRPLRDLMIVEYCAEQNADGLFHKLAMFRIGERMVPSIGVFDTGWSAKTGKKGIAGQAAYDDEFVAISELRHAACVGQVFSDSHADFGRADFGIVGGQPQFYEINTNPFIPVVRDNAGPGDHPYPIRLESGRLSFRMMMEALAEIDLSEPRAGIVIEHERLVHQRRKDRWVTRPSWLP